MGMNRISVDAYLEDGCGRCDKYRTPACKLQQWVAPLSALRELVRGSGLTEEMKWGSPTYTLEGANVVMLGSLVDSCTLSFLQGALLEDAHGVLEAPGPNSRYARLLRFTSVEEVHAQRDVIVQLLQQAIEAKRAGRRVEVEAEPEPVPAELQAVLDADPRVAVAFAALTPAAAAAT